MRAKFLKSPDFYMPSLYRDEIIDKWRFPRHRGVIALPDMQAERANSFCGDEVALFLQLDEKKEKVAEAKFQGEGCALASASAEILCIALEGKTVDELRAFSSEDMIKLYGEPPTPGRIPCVLLAYEALRECMRQAR